MNIKSNILEIIGNTPLIELTQLERYFGLESRIFAKLERNNPTGSIKDRAAKEMILSAFQKGEIDKSTAIVEPTSGNTGISIAAICASLGLRCVIFMPSSVSIERKKLIEALGAEIHLTNSNGGMIEAINEAKQFVLKNNNSFILSQFDNPNNSLSHYKTTGPEIYRDLDGKIDVFITSFGTGGTLSGVAKYLKEKNKNILCYGIEPSRSSFIKERKNGIHKIQGIGAGFQPRVLELDYIDDVLTVTDEEAYEFTRLLAKKEGIFAGISSGANVAKVVALAKKFTNKNIVTILPDNGERCLSIDNLY